MTDFGLKSEEDYFSLPELDQRLDLLFHLAENSDRIPLVRGGQGLGKTMMLDRLELKAQPNWQMCRILADPMLQPEQLFDRLGLCVQALEGVSVDTLVRRFEDLQNEGVLVVVAVDDAHLLPVSTIIALLRLSERRVGELPLVKVVLFADPEIDGHLKTPQIQAMNLQSLQILDLHPFDADQAKAYVQHILAGHGMDQTSFPVKEQAVERLIKESRGIPSIIEARVRELLGQGPDPDLPEAKASGRGLLSDLSGPALIGIGLVVLLVVAALIFQDHINTLFEDEKLAEQVLPEISTAREKVVPLQLPAEEEAKASVPAVKSPGVEKPQEVSEAEPSRSVDDAATPVVADAGLSQDQEGLVESPAVDVASEVTVSEEGVSVQPQLAEAAKESPSEEDAGSSSLATLAQEVEIKGQVTTAVVKQDVAPASALVREAGHDPYAWFLRQKPTDYTLQLVGLGSEAAAKKFISKHGITGSGRVFRSTLNGRPWYSVVYGVFANREAAVKGREQLPAGLNINKTGVWPRSYASIQDTIKKR
ncbi:hypothetical protein BOW51_00130 [Solemya velesiana gill symbiont]|uniref:SPOR domain-containing protein n=2 Tax=Solemya velesiana gill symbiont TaxID=1918948 RepID=A0A1T2KYF0_9GAMM|nr:hypothetical protein BOW51_00130 [Solemya velesiana gill symbiont]